MTTTPPNAALRDEVECRMCQGIGQVPIQVCCGHRDAQGECCGDAELDYDGCEDCGGSGKLYRAPDTLRDALDRMDSLLDPKCGLLTVPDHSATVRGSRADMALIRAAIENTRAPDALRERVLGLVESWRSARRFRNEADVVREQCADELETIMQGDK